MLNFRPNINNYYFYDNPVIPGDVRWWGYGYPREIFYEIDFENIRTGMYIISSYGRIFSRFTNKELVPVKRYHDNHLTIMLTRNGEPNRTFLIHRLVAYAFIWKTEEDIMLGREYVNHKNLVQWDNTVWNLEWCTQWENDNHARENNAYGKSPLFTVLEERPKLGSVGENNGQAQLTAKQVHIICQALEQGLNNKTCCQLAGIEYTKQNNTKICHIKSGRKWKSISSQYNIL